MPVTVAAIIPAAGRGTRLHAADAASASPASPERAVAKALHPLAGRPMLQYSLDLLAPFVDEIVVALPPELVSSLRLAVSPGVSARTRSIHLVEGGAERQDSVRLALDALATLDPDTALVLVHDAARPLVPAEVVVRVLAALEGGAGCVVPVVEVEDSIRLVAPDDSTSSPVDRTALRRVQTPQGFRAGLLREAHTRAIGSPAVATDDASLVEALGTPVTTVPGDPLGFKVTRALDVVLVEALLRSPTT